MDSFLARVCWNDRNWMKPAGVGRELETDTFVARCGFGYEEWLFSSDFEVGGWQFGFVQGVQRHHSDVEGQELGLRLFTKGKAGKRFMIGSISRCTVLDFDEAQAAVCSFMAKGLIQRMVNEVDAVGGASNEITQAVSENRPLDILNIRFKFDRRVLEIPLKPATNPIVARIDRYMLTKLPPS